MLYLLYGTDEKKARAKLHSLLQSLVQKKPDASVMHVKDDSFKLDLLDEYIEGQGLFESKQIVVFDFLFGDKETKEAIVSRRKELGTSENIFFLLEQELDKATLTKLEQVTERSLCFGERKREGKKERVFNTFSLADALGSRDKKKLWTLYQRAQRATVADEEIHGVFFWQAKSMLLAKGVKSASLAGLNPFVYKKAVAFAKNYSDSELYNLSRDLISLSHDARRGKHNFSIALERFILGL